MCVSVLASMLYSISAYLSSSYIAHEVKMVDVRLCVYLSAG